MSESSNLPTTVSGTLRYALKLYDSILDTSPLDAKYQPAVALCISLFLRLWSHIVTEGTFRKGESLREMTDLNLEMIPVPFYLGMLCEKRMMTGNNNNNNNGLDSNHSQQQQQQQQKRGATTSETDKQIQDRVSRSYSRVQSLIACNDFLFKFLAVCVELKFATEKDVATKPFIGSLDRNTRLEISKKRYALEDEVKQLDTKVRFARERAKRNAKIMREDEKQEKLREMNKRHENDDDEDDESLKTEKREAQERQEELSIEFLESLLEDDDEYQSNRRLKNVRMVEWAIYESYSLLQGNSRELEILGSLSDDEKKKAVEDFQHQLNDTKGGFNVLGGSGSVSASSGMYNFVVNQEMSNNSNNGKNTSMLNVENKNYTVLPGGNVVPFGSVTTASLGLREQIRDEAFMNRNNPTQTLQEFAELEMVYMKQMQENEARGKREHEEENERLGEEGVGERDRQKDSAWDNWKDDNPAVGITSKGNYS